MMEEEDHTFLTGLSFGADDIGGDDQLKQDQQMMHDHEMMVQEHNLMNDMALEHQQEQRGGPLGMSLDAMIEHVESQMREFERDAQYLDAEKARIHLESLQQRKKNNTQRELEAVQQEDVRVFLDMVAQHQESFDRTWQKKIAEHKMRADDLIDQLKWKHDDQQRQLYEQLRKKRMPKFSVELLNMRKKQVLLARNQDYVKAEKVKRKADILEAFEIDNIRRAAKEENQVRFKALLKRQHWDRQGLADKLRIEKRQLLEAKAQDFERLKKRLRNAEGELKKTHVRQALESHRKIGANFTTLTHGGQPLSARRANTLDVAKGHARTMGAKVYGSSSNAVDRPKRSVEDLTDPGGHSSQPMYEEDDSLAQFTRQSNGAMSAR